MVNPHGKASGGVPSNTRDFASLILVPTKQLRSCGLEDSNDRQGRVTLRFCHPPASDNRRPNLAYDTSIHRPAPPHARCECASRSGTPVNRSFSLDGRKREACATGPACPPRKAAPALAPTSKARWARDSSPTVACESKIHTAPVLWHSVG